MKVQCIVDDLGYWTVGEIYVAEQAGAGRIYLPDDEQPLVEGGGWIAEPIAYEDDENNTATYALGGVPGNVQFKEVAPL